MRDFSETVRKATFPLSSVGSRSGPLKVGKRPRKGRVVPPAGILTKGKPTYGFFSPACQFWTTTRGGVTSLEERTNATNLPSGVTA